MRGGGAQVTTDLLSEWTDPDTAMEAVGNSLGVFDHVPSAVVVLRGDSPLRTALYDVLPAANRPIKPAGEFNQSRVVVNGRNVEHWLNGTRVLQYELSSPALQAAIDKSKFKGIERFGKPQKGHILVQDHGDRVWYRSIRIKAVAPTAAAR